MESAFNLFRMPRVWRSFFAFAKKVPCSLYPSGDPNKWVYVAITTVPTGWVGAVDLTQASPWCSQFCPSWVVLSGPCLRCNILWACETFAAGFRRPLFSIFQDVYSEVKEWDPKDAVVPRSASVVELLIAVLLVPLAGVDLRTPLRNAVSCSDASHAGAGASEAVFS